ncbi:MAG: pilus assembly protein [Deltaproteobacteria bacterium]|nr:pilus assembly protein [Deltaproteobacteria bacterium]
MRKLRSSRRGSNAIEFALTLPIFVILLSGMIDFSWYFFTGWRVSSAVREGVRVASLTPLYDDPVSRATTAVSNAGTAYDVTWASGSPSAQIIGTIPDRGIRVDAEAEVPPLIGILPITPTSVRYEAVMRLEDQS